MKAIVVIFFRIREGRTSERQLPEASARMLQAPAGSRDRSWTPPLWTWFIQNPRPVQNYDIAV
jgi:hypothetical protein